MKTIALLLSFISAPLFAANPSFNDFNTTQFGTSGNKVNVKTGALVTNLDSYGTTLFETNSMIRGGTNLIFGLQDSDSTNKITGSAAGVIIGTARNQGTNHVGAEGSAIVGVSSNNSANVVSGSIASIIVGLARDGSSNQITAGGGNLLVGSAGLNTGRSGQPSGRNRVSGSGSVGVMTSYVGGVNTASGDGAVTVGLASGGANNNSSFGSIMAASATAGSTNTLSGSGSLFFGSATGGGQQTSSGSGSAFVGTATGAATNTASGQGSFSSLITENGSSVASVTGYGSLAVALSTNGGNSTVSGRGSRLFGFADQATNLVSGVGSMLFGYSDSTLGSTVLSGSRSFLFGSGATNASNDTFSYFSRGAPLLFASTNFVGINTNGAGSGIALEVNGSGHVSTDFKVDGFLEASHGSLTMCTGIVTVATSQSTNLINNIWSYHHVDAPLGIETNTLFVVTNAAHFFISFGAAVSANASGSGTISLHVSTNGVLCDSILFFEAPSQGAATYETGFKEFAIDLPAMCRVGLWVGETTAQSVNLKNVCFNMKGGN